jgi:uncharacterized protein YpuA (DUF1002 family)
MTHYHAPLTFEQKVDVVLEGIFQNDEIRKDVFDKIIDDVKHEFELYKMETNINAVQNVVTLILFRKIMR